MAKSEEEYNSTAVNLISTGTSFEGKFKSMGSLRIDGSFKGELEVGSKLVIGPQGRVEGQIVCRSADVEGTVEVTTLTVSESLSLKASASIKGDVSAEKLMIEQGAVLIGRCSMPDRGEKRRPMAAATPAEPAARA